MATILYEGEGSRDDYRVVEQMYNQRPSRLLLSGKEAPQSGLALDDDPELLFDYNQRFLEIALSLQPRRVLVVGGGAFTFPKALIERFPEVTVDAVEVDSLLPHLARRYFDLPDSPRLQVIVQDGREYIDSCQEQYDLIVVDAFARYDIPRSLVDSRAASEYARLLRPKGAFAMNLISEYYTMRSTLAHELLDTFRPHFRSVDLYPADPNYPMREEQNYLLVASHNPLLHLDYLQSAPVKKDI